MTVSKKDKPTRRRFLKVAAAGAAATVATPAIAQSQGPINIRWQSTWPAKDIFHEYALDYAKKVNDMTGGDLKIEVLPAGAVVPAFGLLDAVSKGTLDGGHGVLVYHYGKQTALALWGSGPGYGMDANMLLAWHKYGGGKELLQKLYASIGANVVSFPYGPMPTQPLGWFKKPVTKSDDLKEHKIPHRRHLDRRVHRSGRRGQRVAWRRNRLGDGPRPARCGRVQQRIVGPRPWFPDVSKICMLQSYHQNAEQFEIMFNKTKYDALPEKMKAIIANATEAASQDMAWKAIDRYSKDYEEMQTKDKVQILQDAWTRSCRNNSKFTTMLSPRSLQKIRCSRRSWNPNWRLPNARRNGSRIRWSIGVVVYNHYFGPNAKKKT